MKNSSRLGWLKNGNLPGDFSTAPRCGAKTRRGTPCQCPAIANKARCRLHGGLSTGPKTWEGIERIQAANTKHGRYRKVERERQRRLRAIVREALAERRAMYRKPPRV